MPLLVPCVHCREVPQLLICPHSREAPIVDLKYLLLLCSDADKAKVLSMLKRLEKGDESLADVLGDEQGEESGAGDVQTLEERLGGLDLGEMGTYVGNKP